MSRFCRPAWAETNLRNVAHNVKQFRRILNKDCQLMAVVKANAYGHGSLEVARTALASGANWLAVALPEEGIQLRRDGIAAPILVLGALCIDQLEPCVTKDLVTTVFQWETAQALSNIARRLQKTARIHIKVDTGMGRLGLHPDQVVDFVQSARKLAGIEVQGLFTHFASADAVDQDYTRTQWERFQKVLYALKSQGVDIPYKHCANTAGALFYPETHLNIARIGLGIYGLYPDSRRPIVLQPALSLKCRVAVVRRVSPGTAISYGSTYVTWKETSIAVLPLGYGDGISRRLGNRGEVLIGGQKYPIVGRVTMDHTMVDVGDASIESGEEVVLLGKQGDYEITADDWAEWIGTINYEIPCMLGSRLERIYT